MYVNSRHLEQQAFIRLALAAQIVREQQLIRRVAA